MTPVHAGAVVLLGDSHCARTGVTRMTVPDAALAPPLAMARWFVGLGFPVFPVPRPRPGAVKHQPGDGKVPDQPWGEWQTHSPNDDDLVAMFGGDLMNIAIVTGRVSGVVVVDADSALALRWCTAHLPYTPWQTCTAGGHHLFYGCAETRVANRTRIETAAGRLAIDVRGDGGYVIAPGSRHLSGATYRFAGDWSAPRTEVPQFRPEWLVPPTRPAPPAPRTFRSTRAALDRARAYLAVVPRPEIGSGSDAATLSAACRLVRGFDLPPSDAEALLWEWCGGREGWTRAWVARKVAHALRYGTEPVGGLLR
jgi:hypothetical protein